MGGRALLNAAAEGGTRPGLEDFILWTIPAEGTVTVHRTYIGGRPPEWPRAGDLFLVQRVLVTADPPPWNFL